jgi:hypothetical protein
MRFAALAVILLLSGCASGPLQFCPVTFYATNC